MAKSAKDKEKDKQANLEDLKKEVDMVSSWESSQFTASDKISLSQSYLVINKSWQDYDAAQQPSARQYRLVNN